MPNKAYDLSKEQKQQGFMGVFNWAYSGDPRKTMLKLAFSPLQSMASLTVGKFPAAKTPEQRKERKNLNQAIQEWEKQRLDRGLNQYTSLKKVNNGSESHFLLKLPVVQVSAATPESVDHVLALFGGEALTDEARQEFIDICENKGEAGGEHYTIFPAAKVLAKAGLNTGATTMFSQCLNGVGYSVTDRTVTIFLEFKIKQDEACYLVSTDWAEIRPVDLYPIFTMWVEAEYVSKFYGKSAISISKIAETLPQHLPEDERVDQNNLTIDLKGQVLWIPRDCNNTNKYESMFSAAGQQGGGEFALRKPGSSNVPKLPLNIPILTDWVNNKFTYSDTTGKPQIIDLAHMRKCNSSMAMNLMKRPMHDGFVPRISHYAEACNMSVLARNYGADTTDWPGASDDMSIEDYTKFAMKQYYELTRAQSITFFELMETLNVVAGQNKSSETEAELLLQPIARFIVALAPVMVRNIESLFVKYAVTTMVDQLGQIQLLASYGSDLATTIVEANTINKPAIQQGIDKNWVPPELPLVTKKLSEEGGGILPHQAKIKNIMRNRPDLAAWPVDAGGGKSMLAITDILDEIKHGESAPYMVMCPSHLVANYVSEIVEFTDGKLNVIPVTSYNIRTTGIERMTEILMAAPINTIIVVDYDALKFRARTTVYGTQTIKVYPVIEMLRQFKPNYALLDESHFLRNTSSARMKAVMTLIADVKKKRIASGTMNPDSPSDLPGQMAILDPTVFGTRQEFNERYGAKISGNRVLQWNQTGPNAVSTVLGKLKESVVWAPAKRKEWACALPPRKDLFLSVDFTPRQKEMYDAIFDEMISSIRKAAETDKNAKALLEKLTGKKASSEDEDKFGDLGSVESEDEDSEDDVDDIGPSLQPYLADIERFVTNPAFHPYAKNGFINAEGQRVPPLSGDDLKSPKALLIQQRLREYLDTHDAKALIFTNYNESTDSLFNSMPDDLKACGLLYKTENKTEMVNAFKTNPKIRWMIGIRKSLEVGLNLQAAGFLGRAEGCWTPGEQEQGDSRIERPNFSKNGDKRPELVFETYVVNRTLDVTKAARLRAKIVQLAKFDNPTNPEYQAIPEIPVIPMTLDNIVTMNDFDTNLVAYQDSMSELSRIIKAENSEYKDKMLAEGGFKFTQIKQAPVPPGAALLARVPYAQGTELYKASEMGLVRVDNYMGLELTDEEEGEDDVPGATEDDESGDSEVIQNQRKKIMGLRCHCEFGDGIIIGASARGGNFVSRINVLLDDGSKAIKLRATNVFIMTRTETNGIDMRNKIAQAAGLQMTAPITVPGTIVRQPKISPRQLEIRKKLEQKEKLKNQKSLFEKKSKLTVGLQLSMMNGYMRLSYDIGTNEGAVKALEAIGFRRDPAYYFTRIKSARHLIKQAEAWMEGGFELSKTVDNDALDVLTQELASGSLSTSRRYARTMAAGNFRNYLRQEFKPSADKKRLCLFALVTDGGDTDPGALKDAEKMGVNPNFGVAYLCLPMGGGFPGSKLAISSKYKAQNSRWMISNPTLSMFVNNLAGAAKIINQIQAAGVTVTNGEILKQQAKSVKRLQPKDDETLDFRVDEEPEVEEPEEEAVPAKKTTKQRTK